MSCGCLISRTVCEDCACCVDGRPRCCTSTCIDYPSINAQIAGKVRLASSLRTMIVSSQCAVVSNRKNESYNRVLMKRKACLH